MGFLESIGSIGPDFIKSITGVDEQVDAAKAAQAQQQTFLDNMLAFQDKIFQGGAPFRQLSLDQLRRSLGSDSIVNPAFDLAQREGLDVLGNNASTIGDPGSGASQIAKGRFSAGIAGEKARSLINQQNVRGQLALGAGNIGTGATGQAASLFGPAAGVQGNISNLTQIAGSGDAQGFQNLLGILGVGADIFGATQGA